MTTYKLTDADIRQIESLLQKKACTMVEISDSIVMLHRDVPRDAIYSAVNNYVFYDMKKAGKVRFVDDGVVKKWVYAHPRRMDNPRDRLQTPNLSMPRDNRVEDENGDLAKVVLLVEYFGMASEPHCLSYLLGQLCGPRFTCLYVEKLIMRAIRERPQCKSFYVGPMPAANGVVQPQPSFNGIGQPPNAGYQAVPPNIHSFTGKN